MLQIFRFWASCCLCLNCRAVVLGGDDVIKYRIEDSVEDDNNNNEEQMEASFSDVLGYVLPMNGVNKQTLDVTSPTKDEQ